MFNKYQNYNKNKITRHNKNKNKNISVIIQQVKNNKNNSQK